MYESFHEQDSHKKLEITLLNSYKTLYAAELLFRGKYLLASTNYDAGNNHLLHRRGKYEHK